MEKLTARIHSYSKVGFLWGGVILIALHTLLSIYIYQGHVENGEGLFYTIFPEAMENVYVETFQLWPFVIFGLVSMVVFFFKGTSLDADAEQKAGKGKAVFGFLIPQVILFFVFFLCCLLFDKLNFSEGMFSADGYMNFLTVIQGIVMVVINWIICALCKIFGMQI